MSTLNIEYFDRLIVTVKQANDIVPMDDNGFSDPYMIITYGGVSLISSVKLKTLNPIYNETFIWILDTQFQNRNLKYLKTLQHNNIENTKIVHKKHLHSRNNSLIPCAFFISNPNVDLTSHLHSNRKSGHDDTRIKNLSKHVSPNILNQNVRSSSNNHSNSSVSTISSSCVNEIQLQHIKNSHYKIPNHQVKLENSKYMTSLMNENIYVINTQQLDEVKFQVWDKDFLGDDDFCGSAELSASSILNSDNSKFTLKLKHVKSGELILTAQFKFSSLCDYPNDDSIDHHIPIASGNDLKTLDDSSNSTISLENVHSTLISSSNYQKSEFIKYIGNLTYPLGWKLEKIDEMRVLCRSPTELFDEYHRYDFFKIELEVGLLDMREVYVTSSGKYKNFTEIPLESSSKLGYHYYTFLFQYEESGNKLFQYVCVIDIGSACAIVVRYISNCALKNQHLVHQVVANSELVKGSQMFNVIYWDVFEQLWVRVPFGWQNDHFDSGEGKIVVFHSPLELRESEKNLQSTSSQKTHLEENGKHQVDSPVVDRFELTLLTQSSHDMSQQDVSEFVKSLIVEEGVEIMSEWKPFDQTLNHEHSEEDSFDPSLVHPSKNEPSSTLVHKNYLQIRYNTAVSDLSRNSSPLTIYELVMIIHRVDRFEHNHGQQHCVWMFSYKSSIKRGEVYHDLFFEMAREMKFPSVEASQ
ncbi:hypothetical protein C9374_001742 [Naegleria lovaniensis]|uniref:C2 domain-containing protein n=1 Tax=Naegleria lovaniensis TaxID=51637 RepID=A0AA88GR88_NAELO|nr:uncharacterized protein C9374_001742 [Naegleria lovaniensis]KAG2387410.1 hypothetical protein C9374_001742 [Naegleria lovaniensis]